MNTSEIKHRLIGHTEIVWSLELLNNGYLASASLDADIIIWNTKNGTLKTRLSGHNHSVQQLKLLSNGDMASVSRDGTIIIWDTLFL